MYTFVQEFGVCSADVQYETDKANRKKIFLYACVLVLHIPLVLLHTNIAFVLQALSSNSPTSLFIQTQCVLSSGLPADHLRKVDVLPSSQYCTDGDGSELDDVYLYRPIQVSPSLHTARI